MGSSSADKAMYDAGIGVGNADAHPYRVRRVTPAPHGIG